VSDALEVQYTASWTAWVGTGVLAQGVEGMRDGQVKMFDPLTRKQSQHVWYEADYLFPWKILCRRIHGCCVRSGESIRGARLWIA
jgi:hypothetical protein